MKANAAVRHPVRFQKLCFLGTSSATPTRTRNVTGTVLGFDDGSCWLFDCGEGTQHQLIRSTVGHGKIDKIFITHLHGDHCFGLAGLLCTMSLARLSTTTPPPASKTSATTQTEAPDADADGMADEGCVFAQSTVTCKDAPEEAPGSLAVIDIFGPFPTGRYIRSVLNATCCHMMFRYRVHEAVPSHVSDSELDRYMSEIANSSELKPKFIRPTNGIYTMIEGNSLDAKVQAAELKHAPCLTCIGYVMTEPTRPGQMLNEKLAKLNVPGPLRSKLKNGESVTLANGTVVRPEDVLGPTQEGRKVVLLGDTYDSTGMVPIASEADYLVQESTFDDERETMAIAKGHSTAGMAGRFARLINAKNLILTHFSARFSGSTSSGGGSKSSSPALKLADSSITLEPSQSSHHPRDETDDGNNKRPKTDSSASTSSISPRPASSSLSSGALAEFSSEGLFSVSIGDSEYVNRARKNAALTAPLVAQAIAAFGKPNVMAASDLMDISLVSKKGAA